MLAEDENQADKDPIAESILVTDKKIKKSKSKRKIKELEKLLKIYIEN